MQDRSPSLLSHFEVYRLTQELIFQRWYDNCLIFSAIDIRAQNQCMT